jgi:hypothetical protein
MRILKKLIVELIFSIYLGIHMKKFDTNVDCPTCRTPLAPRVLACNDCGIRVEGPFELNEFSRLTSDLLHFLRIFVHCEGRIKDMEKSLGVSYPTVKATMGRLKEALHLPAEPVPEAGEAPLAAKGKTEPPPVTDVMSVLQALERGDVDYQDALREIKRATKRKGKSDEG